MTLPPKPLTASTMTVPPMPIDTVLPAVVGLLLPLLRSVSPHAGVTLATPAHAACSTTSGTIDVFLMRLRVTRFPLASPSAVRQQAPPARLPMHFPQRQSTVAMASSQMAACPREHCADNSSVS